MTIKFTQLANTTKSKKQGTSNPYQDVFDAIYQVVLPVFSFYHHNLSYLGGKDIIKKLIDITNSDRQQDVADVFGIPKSTIATWRQRNLTPFEIAVRTHLRTGVSLEWLLLDKGDPYPKTPTQKHINKKNESKTLFDIDGFSIDDGKLVGKGILAFDKALLNELGVINVMAIIVLALKRLAKSLIGALALLLPLMPICVSLSLNRWVKHLFFLGVD
ncbi:helix-turn-helix transcriptional regulator [Vibrio crassostreae]|uniref:helix-turn-helix transcriptional regulator n=1 Tax=Vibrio crassostreae TaxID=246167 RepID=UPI0028150053|nr:helix-turn-helix transcriptional regulator [Vibrio crassostreae]